MKKTLILASSLLAMSISSQLLAHTKSSAEALSPLPVPFESVFDNSMNDPNVMVYFGDTMFRKGDYVQSMRWMLEAAQYEHPAAIENAKYMIQENLGTYENRESVVAFLEYFAQPRGDEEADLFAQRYLADFYRGDDCVWLSNAQKESCTNLVGDGPKSATDLKRSYFYYEAAAEQNDFSSKYTAGMMNILGLGAPRNVPFGVDMLMPIAESGNVSVTYIIGSIYQLGYWMPQDRIEATQWFKKAAETNHPGALLFLGKNAEAGFSDSDSETLRAVEAENAYLTLLSGVLASSKERSEASYRLGLLYASHPDLANEVKASKYMDLSVKHMYSEKNEFGIKALMWFGEKMESSNLKEAVEYYKQARTHMQSLSLGIQQRHVAVLEKIAHAYGRGQDGNLDRDERIFSQYMKERHILMSKTFIPDVDAKSFQGYSVFTFPG
jgi:TPR repeat protein